MFENSYEYIIKQKNIGKVLVKKVTAITTYILFALVLTVLAIVFVPFVVLLPVLLVIFAFTALIVFITWRFLCVEYEVIIAGGDLILTAIYGKGLRKQILNISINSFVEIGEYNDKAYEEVSKLSLQKNYICISSLSSPDVYYAIFEENKERSIVYFDAPSRAVELLKRNNSGAFRTSARRINGG